VLVLALAFELALALALALELALALAVRARGPYSCSSIAVSEMPRVVASRDAPARLASAALLLLALAARPARADDAYVLELVDLAAYPMAVCLDGTPAAFYWLPGSGSGATKFVSHFQGGAWCGGVGDCAARANGSLGSSSAAFWPRSVSCPPDGGGAPMMCNWDGGNGGLFSTDAAVNPQLADWNKVYFVYCDGGSFGGMVEAPIDAGNGQTIYSRGRYILDALFGTLAARHGLGAATDYVINGNSAGGLAAFLHADYVSALVRGLAPGAKVVAVPDSGFFMDVADFNGNRNLWSSFAETFAFHNATTAGSTLAACLAAKAAGDAWMCVMAPYLLPFITTPLFVSQSFADSWQSGAVMSLPCAPGTCKDNATEAAVEAYMAGFRLEMLAQLAPVLNSAGRHGAFVSSCFEHGTAEHDGAWAQWRVENQTQAATFAMWYSGDGPREWRSAAGFVAAGGDVLPPRAMLVADARALCAATPGCVAVTFEAPAPEPAANVTCYLKGDAAVSGSDAWWTWWLAPPKTAVVDGVWGSNPSCAVY